MDYQDKWTLIYIEIATVILIAIGTIIYASFKILRGKESDIIAINQYALELNCSIKNISRLSNFSRLFLGGLFEISNLSRIYRVIFNKGERGSDIVYFSFDSVTGSTKIRRRSRWQNI